MKLFKKISLFTLIFTLLFSVVVFAEEETTTNKPNIRPNHGETNAPGFNIDTSLNPDQMDWSHTIAFDVLDYGVQNGTPEYESYKYFLSKMGDLVQDFKLIIVNLDSNIQYEVVITPDMAFHNPIEFPYGNYYIAGLQWEQNGNWYPLSMVYYLDNEFTYSESKNEIVVRIDLAKIFYENSKTEYPDACEIKLAGKEFLDYAFESEESSTEDSTLQSSEVLKPVIKPSEDETISNDSTIESQTDPTVENETTASDENEKDGKGFLDWLKNNAFTLGLLLVAIVGFAIFTIKKNKKS